MHFRILPDHQNHVLKKDILLTSGVVKNVFWCIFAYFQTTRNTRNFSSKKIFWTSGVVKNVFSCICAYFQTTRNFFSKKIFLPSGVVKDGFLIYFHILRDHQKLFLKKDIFYRLEWLKTCFDTKTFFKKDIFYRLKWLKTCFDAFSHTPRPPETFFQKRYFLPSGVVQNVFWCIFAYFQTTRIMSLKKIFF